LLGRFAIAQVDGENVYLSAGPAVGGASQIFAIGVPESAGYADFSSTGWSTDATLDTSSVISPQYTLSATVLTLAGPGGPDNPSGIRSATAGADLYFATRSKRLDVLIGGRSPSPKAGFLHLGLIQ
jgi:hypothetical protein